MQLVVYLYLELASESYESYKYTLIFSGTELAFLNKITHQDYLC